MEEIKKAHIEVAEDELKGVPEDEMKELKKVDDGKRKITYFKALRLLIFAKNDDLRKKLIALTDVGEKNLPVIGKIVAKREELAKLRGYDSFSS